MSRPQITLLLAAFCCMPSLSAAPWTELQKLGLANGRGDEAFGVSVAIEGGLAVVGAPREDSPVFDAGAAHLYFRDANGQWGPFKTLTASNAAQRAELGWAVDTDGTTTIVGDGLNQAYVFSRDRGGPSNWGEAAVLLPTITYALSFGMAVAISGDIAIVGDRNDAELGSYFDGAAYIFARNQGGPDAWGQVTKFFSTLPQDGLFGASVAVDGMVALVGEPRGVVGTEPWGAVSVRSRDRGGPDTWGEVTRLTASDGALGAGFGTAVTISGDTAIVGAPDDGGVATSAGAAYVFQKDAGGVDNWGEVAKLVPSDGVAYTEMGISVELDGDVAVVGAYDDVMARRGKVYFFHRNAGGPDRWGEIAILGASDPRDYAGFGQDVAVSDGTALAGAPRALYGTRRAGAVYVLGCPAAILPPTLPEGETGTPYSVTLTVSSGTPPATFTVTAGALPTGFTLTTGGILSGVTGATGDYRFTVEAIDADQCTTWHTYDLRIRMRPAYLSGEGLGASNGNRVRVHDRTGAPTPVDFAAYGAGQWGVNVAPAGVRTDLAEEILTGPGPGPVYGPQVRAFDRAGSPLAKINFYAYATLRYGANVGSGRLDADVYAEMLTGPGPGTVFGPHVRGWDYDNAWLTAMAKVSFFAYGTLQWGVSAAGGDVDADGFAEIATGPGPGPVFAASVRGFDFDGVAVQAIPRINFNAYAFTYGVNVTGGDVDADGYGDLLTAPGPGPTNPSRFLAFQLDGGPLAAIPGFDATPFPTAYGGRTGNGDLTAANASCLVAAAGRDPAADASVRAFLYQGGGLTPLAGTPFLPFPGFYGVNATAAALGY